MRNLLKFIVKYHFIILFILFEIFTINLIIRYNTYHKAKFVNITYSFTGSISKVFVNLREYLSLREENRKLMEENNKLYNLQIT